MGRIDHQARSGATRMLGDDVVAGKHLHNPGPTAHLDLAAHVDERYRVLMALEGHETVEADAAGSNQIERDRQDRQRR